MIWSVVLAAMVIHVAQGRILAGCSVTVNNDLPEPQPLLLEIGGPHNGFGFSLPDHGSDAVNFQPGERVTVACPGSTNFLRVLGTGRREVTATCVSGKTFSINGVNYNFSALNCSAYPFHTARKSGRSCYNGRASEIEIGFEVGSAFYRVLDICFDDGLLNPLYSRFDLVAEIGGYQSGFPRPSWLTGTFYPGVSPNNMYARNNQINAVGNALGSHELGVKYVSNSTDYYLARGHLAAKADFVYGSQHRATFWCLNAAPQWQVFNGGNWVSVESDVRRYASTRRVDLVVYTGTYGVMTLPDIRGVQRELYLYRDANNNVALPIPLLFWKVVYNAATRTGVVLIGVNNPYLTSVPSSYIICTDISNRLTWLTWNKNNIQRGYGYACDVNEFRRVVDFLPSFTVSGILT